jgi:hypothetical protein
MLALKALAAWLLILACAVANGALREGVLLPRLGAAGALIASGLLPGGAIVLISIVLAPWFGARPASHWLAIGACWLALTLVFEFGVGRVMQHKTWAELFAAYTFQGGNLWPLVLLLTALAPWLAARLRGLVAPI